jgi:hypothetical protein
LKYPISFAILCSKKYTLDSDFWLARHKDLQVLKKNTTPPAQRPQATTTREPKKPPGAEKGAERKRTTEKTTIRDSESALALAKAS